MNVEFSVEEWHAYLQSPFGAHTVRFIRGASNTVMIFVESDLVAAIKETEQQQLAGWLMRRVGESL